MVQMRVNCRFLLSLHICTGLQAFANMTMAIRRALCAVMVYAVVEKAGTVVMNDGEELDSWSVILDGSVKVTYADGSDRVLNMGDRYVTELHTSSSILLHRHDKCC